MTALDFAERTRSGTFTKRNQQCEQGDPVVGRGGSRGGGGLQVEAAGRPGRAGDTGMLCSWRNTSRLVAASIPAFSDEYARI